MISNLDPVKAIEPLFACPVCQAPLRRNTPDYTCQNPSCAAVFPVVDGIPVLIHENDSIFSIEDFSRKQETFFSLDRPRAWRNLLQRFLPSLSRNRVSAVNYRRLAEWVLADTPEPRVLVLGGSIAGKGFEVFLEHPRIRLIETDVSFGPRTQLIVDAHHIPLKPESVDMVVVQAVLEHVADPYQCVSEIWRVLKPRGLVYAETPFMQQVHGWPYDFTRFTPLGHRRLFRRFEEMDSGVVIGPGSALAESYLHFLLSLFRSRRLQRLAKLFAHTTAFFWKYFDDRSIRRQTAMAGASGYFFIGRKSPLTVSDKELIRQARTYHR